MENLMKERAFFVGPYKIDLSDINLDGRILDIGGGGEGVISQYMNQQVIAIDLREEELKEVPENDALKIVMDAKNLLFLENSFNTVTAFFTLLYVPEFDREKIFHEIHRVLKNDGEFVLWDVVIPKRGDGSKDMFVVELEVKIFDKLIKTGYGTSWNKEQDMSYYSDLAKSTGFKVLKQEINNEIFYIRFKKV
jgi:ubiquinone/menaquinone biosynthesis C-methylase UbiE